MVGAPGMAGAAISDLLAAVKYWNPSLTNLKQAAWSSVFLPRIRRNGQSGLGDAHCDRNAFCCASRRNPDSISGIGTGDSPVCCEFVS
jgi:hypothetical protein